MVTYPEYEPLFEPLLRFMEDETAPREDRVDGYLRLTGCLREENDGFVKEVCGCLKRLVAVIKNDILSQELDLSQAALQSLGFCLYQEEIVSSFSAEDIKEMIQVLCQTVESTSEKGVCTRALWCIAKQNIAPCTISTELTGVLAALDSALTRNLKSMTVEHEALCVIERLLNQLPEEELNRTVDQWSKLVWPLLVSSAPKVRDKALATLNSGLKHMIKSRGMILKMLLRDLKSGLVTELKKMFSEKKEVFVLKTWMCIVPVLGKALHKGGDLVNNMLKIVEQGFKTHSLDVQVLSYSAWSVLIDSFALSLDFLCTPRRLKLIMTPLINCAVKERSEAVESARLMTWWHLACSLGARLPEMFEQVCVPLLQFLFGTCGDSDSLLKNREGFGDLKCPPTPTSNKMMTEHVMKTPTSSVRRSLKDVGTPKTPSVINANFAQSAKKQLLFQGCEILYQLLKNGDISSSDRYTAVPEQLRHTVFEEPVTFRKHATVMINVMREAFVSCGRELSDSLALNLLTALLSHVGRLAEEDQRQKIDHEKITVLLLEVIQEIVEKELLLPATSLKVLEIMSKLPPYFMNYHTPCLHSKGNPIVQLLFCNHILQNIGCSERLHVVFENVVRSGMDSPSGQLLHAQVVLSILDSRASDIPKVESLWRLWSSVVTPLAEYIVKTNDVNQGDALQHKFSAVYAALTFPVKHILTDEKISLAISSATTSDLYKCFSRASALVSTAEVNVCAEELSALLLFLWHEESAKKITYLDGLVSLVSTITKCLDFSSANVFGVTTTAAGKPPPTTTPIKWSKYLHKQMGNFTSLVQLMAKLLTTCHKYSLEKDDVQSLGVLGAVITTLMDSVSFLFGHITGALVISGVIQTLAQPLVPLIANSHTSVAKGVKSAGNKRLYTTKFIQKVEKLWSDILTCVQSRYCGPYDSEFLAVMSPLMEVTLCHPRRFLKNHVIMFWNATFAHAHSLDYPDNIKSVLRTTKERASIVLPGWHMVKTIVDETPVEIESDELTQQTNLVKHPPHMMLASPQKRKPLTFGGTSPQQLKGSFLHKALSAEKAVENMSPKKTFDSLVGGSRRRSTPAITHARRKLPLPLDDDGDNEYVFIAPSPKKSRLLTEHQKDVMRSRSVIPALYNVLDQSQDGTLFSSLASQESNQDSTFDNQPVSPSKQLVQGPVELVEAESVKLKDGEIEDAPSKPILIDEGTESACQENLNAVRGYAISNEREKDTETEEETIVIKVENNGLTKQESLQDSLLAIDNGFSPTRQQTASEERDVHSPDVIPSSQTSSSCDSSFQFLALRRRVSVPLHDVSLKTDPAAKEHLLRDSEECQQWKENTLNSEESGNVQDKCCSNDQQPVLNQVSPIAGRTRKRWLGKLDGKKSLPRKSEKEDKSADLKSSHELLAKDKSSHHLVEDEEMREVETRSIKEKERRTLPGKFPREMASSPVPSSKIKFVRPLLAGGSPVQHRVSRVHSLVESPTTSILKRTAAGSHGQAVDSPSPPEKVRRVSFALPVKQENDAEERLEERSVEESQSEEQGQREQAPVIKKEADGMTVNVSYTAIKQRQSVTVTPKQETNQHLELKECVFPDLVDCQLPVEQILPSLAASSWSRGLSHVVHAQNIRTIGNLSALKEQQVRNLPIKSPKVDTLRHVLRTFHTNQRSRGAKTSHKTNSLPTISESIEEKWLTKEDVETLKGSKEVNQSIQSELTVLDPTVDQTLLSEVNINAALDSTTLHQESAGTESFTDASVSTRASEICTDKTDAAVSNVTILSVEEQQVDTPDPVAEEGLLEEKSYTPSSPTEAGLPPVESKICQSEQAIGDIEIMDLSGSDIEVQVDSHTPPLSATKDCLDEMGELETPKRYIHAKRTVLFDNREQSCFQESAGNLDQKTNEVKESSVATNTGHDTAEHGTSSAVEEPEEAIACQSSCSLDGTVEHISGTLNQHTYKDLEKEELDYQSNDPQNERLEVTENKPSVDSRKEFYQGLHSFVQMATPEVLDGLSSADIFECHQELARLMSNVVLVLKERCKSPK